MAYDASATLVGAAFGSPFPTGIYIGQPAFKAMGAHSAYMALNSVVVLAIATLDLTAVVFGVSRTNELTN